MVRLILLLAVGLGAAWGVCRFTTPRYEARCECEVSFGQSTEGGFEENLNTRLVAWQTDVCGAWPDVEIVRVPRSRLIAVTARGEQAEEVASRANVVASALASHVEKVNASRAAAAVAQVRAQVERQRQVDEELARKLLAIRTANASEGGASGRRILEESLSKTIGDIKEAERRVREAGAWSDLLEVARTRPAEMGAIPASVPADAEVRIAHRAWSAARGRLAKLRTKYTEAHPEIEAAKIALIATAKDFSGALTRASAAAEGDLKAAQDQLKAVRRKASLLRADLERMEITTTEASGGIERLEQEKKVARELYEDALRKESELSVNAGQDADHVRVVRTAAVPAKPIYPNSTIVYSIGAGAPVLLWMILAVLWPSAPRRRRCRVVR